MQSTSDPGPPGEAIQRRALPGRSIDLIRDGVRREAIRLRGHDPAVWSALVSTAMSAVNRNWTGVDFVGLVLEPKSNLGAQAALKNGKTRGARQTVALLYQAWEQAEKNVRRSPAWTSEDLARSAQQNIERMTDELRALPISGAERLVMLHVTRRLRESGSVQTAISRRDFIDSTGLGQTALATAQRNLMASGHLVQVEKGRPGGPNAHRRRAHVWALPGAPGPARNRERRAHSSNTGNRYVAPALPSGAPSAPSTRSREVVAFETLTSSQIDALIGLLVRTVGVDEMVARLTASGSGR